MTVAQPLSSFDQSALPLHPVQRWMQSGSSGVSEDIGGSEKAGIYGEFGQQMQEYTIIVQEQAKSLRFPGCVCQGGAS